MQPNFQLKSLKALIIQELIEIVDTWNLISNLFSVEAHAAFRALPLAVPLENSADIQSYLVSEKYDGIRAYWDGKTLYSRQGKPISLPKDFTKQWPTEALDGELWLGRGRFSQLMSLLQTKKKHSHQWQNVTFMVFDAPDFEGTLLARQAHLKALLLKYRSHHLQRVEQKVFLTEQLFQSWYQAIIDQGAEGCILRKKIVCWSQGEILVIANISLTKLAKRK